MTALQERQHTMSNVVVIRPGCTDFDEQSRIQGTLDLPLTDRGEEQVGDLIEQLRPLPLETIYCASCEPSRSTATRIGQELGVPTKELDGLTNLDQGLWQGLAVEEVRRKFPKVFKQWHEQPETICPPEGETVADAVGRLRKALHRPLRKRGMIGVVVPEPLATLLCCDLRGTPPLIPDLPCGGVSPPSIAILTDHEELGNGHWTETPLVPDDGARSAEQPAAARPVAEQNGQNGNESSGEHGLPLSRGEAP